MVLSIRKECWWISWRVPIYPSIISVLVSYCLLYSVWFVLGLWCSVGCGAESGSEDESWGTDPTHVRVVSGAVCGCCAWPVGHLLLPDAGSLIMQADACTSCFHSLDTVLETPPLSFHSLDTYYEKHLLFVSIHFIGNTYLVFPLNGHFIWNSCPSKLTRRSI